MLKLRRIIKGFVDGRRKSFSSPSSEDLLAAVAASEKDYLAFGSELRRIYEWAMEVSKVSASLAGLSEGGRLDNMKRTLTEFFDKNRDIETESGQGASILEAILEKAIQIETRLKTFRNVVRTLQVLCNFIKIESIRSSEGKDSFHALAEDVGALAGKIEEKTFPAMDRCRFLVMLGRENLARVLGFEQSRQEKGRIIAERIMDDLGTLSDQHHTSSQRRVRIRAAWEEITNSIGEIVSSLQFHDITRQRIEHVAEAMRKLSEENHMEEAYEVYELQRAQLLHTKGELASATERIGKELRNLSRRISEMSREAGGAPEDGLGAGGSFFSVLEKAVVELTEVVNEQSEINKEMASTIESLSWAVSQMEGFVKEIVKIGIEMKMISLNAAIHAAHVGEQGLALGVLAEHIHSLSQATSGKMTSISEDLNCIVDHAGRLKNSAGVVSRRKAGEGLQMIEDLNRMIPYLRGLDAEAICMLKRIDTEGAGLSMETRKRTEALHFHEQIIQGIESLASEIEKECTRIGSRLKNKGKRGNRSNGIAGMEELAKSYTMQKERDVHRSMLGRLEAKGRSFSTGDEADPYEVIRKGNVEELGENVELF